MSNYINKKLLQNWVDNGLAVKDLGDGAWGWTELGKTTSKVTRMYLSNMLFGDNNIPNYLIRQLSDEGFSTDGYVLEE